MCNVVSLDLAGRRLSGYRCWDHLHFLHADLVVLLGLVRRRLSGCPFQGARGRTYGRLASRVPPDNAAKSLRLAQAVLEVFTHNLMM